MGEIIVGGQRIQVDAQCQTWEEHELVFDGDRVRRRTEPLRWGVVHWTGSGSRLGKAGARRVYDTLYRRGLSVHFVITDEGLLWQFADPVTERCAHAGRLNDTSLGVEVTCPGWRSKYVGQRRTYEATIHGWKTTFIDFYPAQQATLNALATALADAQVLPPHVETSPWEREGDEYFEENAGWCGHLHCERESKKHPKCDPGTAPLEALKAHFDSWVAEPTVEPPEIIGRLRMLLAQMVTLGDRQEVPPADLLKQSRRAVNEEVDWKGYIDKCRK
ncbi:MAG: peptidoglycan recognition protein family protein [Planctomycetota bacterium]|jgi:hypothetical protein